MTIVPVRALPGFEPAENPTVPLPAPFAPDVTTSHEVLLAADHEHPGAVVTDTFPPAPVAATSWLVGDTLISHPRPGCATRTRMSFSTIVPSRDAAFGFAATWNRTSPLPCPDVGVMPLIHGASDAADHAHSGCVVTVTDPAPPAELEGASFSASET